MDRPRHRRQIGLFLIAVVLPSLLLLGLGIQVLRQERELAEKRLADLERSSRRQMRDALRSRLEDLRFRVAQDQDLTDPGLVLAAPLEEGRMSLPWEVAGDALGSGVPRRDTAYGREMTEGQRQELALKRTELALRHYRKALTQASRPGESGLAHLQLARSLAKLGRAEEAAKHYMALLKEDPQPVDEFGMPLWMYAAELPTEGGGSLERILDRLEAFAVSARWPSPLAAYRSREILEQLATADLEETHRLLLNRLRSELDPKIRDLERLLALRQVLPELLRVHADSGASGSFEPLWIAHGEQLWLVGTVNDHGPPGLAIVVDGPELWRKLVAAEDLEETPFGAPQLVSSRLGQVEPLGAGFAGLAIAFSGSRHPEVAALGGTQRRLLIGAVAVVVGVTLFGAYLLWLDVRREVRTTELRSQFVASVSHELKTPLTAIRMFAETLAMGRPEDPARRTEYLDTIVNESERLSRLLDNVLDFSKIEHGTKQYRLRPVDLAEVVQAAARTVRYPLGQQGFELEVQVDHDLPPARADADALEQALLNLLGNAMKFSGQSRTLRLSLTQRNGRARIEVTDFGVGIPQGEQRRVFDKFYRADSAEADRIPGAGLGLALVKHIAQAHGGAVELQSVPGEGSTFVLDLPLEEAL